MRGFFKPVFCTAWKIRQMLFRFWNSHLFLPDCTSLFNGNALLILPQSSFYFSIAFSGIQCHSSCSKQKNSVKVCYILALCGWGFFVCLVWDFFVSFIFFFNCEGGQTLEQVTQAIMESLCLELINTWVDVALSKLLKQTLLSAGGGSRQTAQVPSSLGHPQILCFCMWIR